MGKLTWFALGAAIGVIALRQYQQNPRIAEVVDESRRAVEDFNSAVVEGFREREAELKAERQD